MKKSILILIFFVYSSFTFASNVNVKVQKVNDNLQLKDGGPYSTLVNINNLAMWIRNDGYSARNPNTGNSGVTYPRGTSTVIFQDGLVWGGKVNDGQSPQLRTGGQTYNIGTQGGKITGGITATSNTIVAETQTDPSVRIYRIRKDWATADLKQDAAEILSKPLNQVNDGDVAQIRDQYKKDWLEWPSYKGAPFYNKDGVPGYQPNSDATTEDDIDEPGFAGGDQVVWFVANDLNPGLSSGLYGSPPIGMEMQVTLWGYARSDALGNVIFKRFRFIYKGTVTTPYGSTIDSMYVAQWSDPDLGDYGDDFAGSDTSLSLGFVYNSTSQDAEFAQYGIAPPSSGYDFFAGPIVPSPGDSAVFDLQQRQGYKNLPMTSFIYFAAGGHYTDPPLEEYDGTVQWYNMLTGHPPTPQGPPPPPFIQYPAGINTQFWLSGDPVKKTGWYDGGAPGAQFSEPAGDRRIILASGPFNMALGDTQEVVVALLAGKGSNNLKSVNVLKFIDKSAQQAYKTLFNVPKGAENPNVGVTELNKELLFEWESDTSLAKRIENYSEAGYKFEGYNVYQLPSITADFKTAKLLATFDIDNALLDIKDEQVNEDGDVLEDIVARGTNSGIERFIRITEDKFRNRPLVNGRNYYFAVTSYSVNLDGVPKVIESPLLVQVVQPHFPNPGTEYSYNYGDEITEVENIVGDNNATFDISVFNPDLIDGKTYQVEFNGSGNSKTWSLISEGEAIIQDNSSFDGTQEHFVFRGFNFGVIDAPSEGLRRIAQVDTSDNTVANIFQQTDPTGTYRLYGASDEINDFTTSLSGLDSKYEIRFDSRMHYARAQATSSDNLGYWVQVPFSVWVIDSMGVNVNRQVFPAVFDKNGDGVWNTTGNTKIDNFAIFDTIIGISRVGYKDTSLFVGIAGNNLKRDILKLPSQKISTILFADVKGNGSYASSGTTILFETMKAVKDGDVKQFKFKPVIRNSNSLAKEMVQKINVYPNPYYGLNVDEIDRFNRYVTFNHLPSKVEIRIFDLAGNLVRVLVKESNHNDDRMQWDLQNQDGLPVASGIYIAHIDMKEIGETKILKLMIVQEQQFLPKY